MVKSLGAADAGVAPPIRLTPARAAATTNVAQFLSTVAAGDGLRAVICEGLSDMVVRFTKSM